MGMLENPPELFMLWKGVQRIASRTTGMHTVFGLLDRKLEVATMWNAKCEGCIGFRLLNYARFFLCLELGSKEQPAIACSDALPRSRLCTK